MVDVDSGPVRADQRFDEVPVDKWDLLMWEKRDFIKRNLNYDCRNLVQFVKDAEDAYKELGFDSANEMISHGYELEPNQIRIAVEWLELEKPDEPISLDAAVKKVHDLHDLGKSFREIEKETGIPKSTAHRLSHKLSVHTKSGTPKRKVIQYKISQYTKPATAAKKIRDKFGDEFAMQLANEIMSITP